MIASFLTVGQQVLILFALMAVGFALGKTGRMDDKSSLTLTNLVIYAVSPAMMVVAFQREKDTADLHNFFVCMLLAVVSTWSASPWRTSSCGGRIMPAAPCALARCFPTAASWAIRSFWPSIRIG